MNTAHSQRIAIRIRLLAGLFAALALAGCQTTSQIIADDKRVSLPSLRVAVSLDEPKQTPAEPQTGKAIEFGLVRAKGSGEQALAAGRPPIVYNNTTFLAPEQLKNDFDINYADISFRWRKFFREKALGLELSGGIGHTSMGLTVSSTTQNTSARFNNYGAQGGVGLIWRMRPATSLHAHVSGFAGRDEVGLRDMGRYQLFLAQALGDNLALRAGYAKWEVNGKSGLGASDFRMTFSGPTLDVGLNF
ncbi:MAG: hypothetical protein HZB95_01645 [Nitrosomonadales bacterium]|nr:hypothetical protein [Nitrosomonadales bacterium]